MKIAPARSVRGTLTMPGDKSISHRAAMLAAIAVGETRIREFAPGADCRSTLRCLEQLGVRIASNGSNVTIEGRGLSGLSAPQEPLDCGNSGTTMRLLAGIAAGQQFSTVLTGDASLSSRPMARIIEPISRMGAEAESADGRAPLAISGRSPLAPIDHDLTQPSAQVKSCVLLAGLFADGTTSVTETTATRDHTERMLAHFGIDVSIADGRIAVRGGCPLTAADVVVPGDISSAAFFLVAAACLPGSEIELESVGINPTRSAILDLLQKCGAEITISDVRSAGPEPSANIRVRYRPLTADHIRIDGDLAASLIDEAPALAVLGTRLRGGLSLLNAGDLRNKECDRIDAVCRNLSAMGASVEEFADGFHIHHSDLTGAAVESFGDHRIAMSMAVAALLAKGTTGISGAECVNISYPGFFDSLDSVVM